MAKVMLSYEDIIEQARASWGGSVGDKRAADVKEILDTRLENYSKVTGFTKEEILNALEKNRGVNTVNFYQASQLPLLEDVYVFETTKDLHKRFPSHKFICPSCGKESTDAYACTQDGCNWKVFGLFRDLGKGISTIVKDKFLEIPVPQNIFKPIELAEEEKKYLFDIDDKRFYKYNQPELKKRTRRRLREIAEYGMSEVAIASFGYKDVTSGLYLEKIWNYSDEEFKSYMDWASGIIKEKKK